MSMKKLLTILIPVYNTEKYIKRCLDSVLMEETNDLVEIIIVSDGSKDQSLEIAKSYQKNYPNTIVIVDKENGGHGSTINKGIEIATGKYFRVLDSDDWFNSIDFINFVKSLENEDADLVITNYRQEHIYNSDSNYFEYKNLIENTQYNFDNFDLSKLDGEYFVMATSTYKVSILRESNLKLMEKTFYVDMQYNIVPIIKVKTFVYYNYDIYRYFIGRKEQSVNLQSFVKNQDHHENVLKFLLDFYNSQKNMSQNKKTYIYTIIKYMLNTHYSIYCIYDKNHKSAYTKIRSFDNYLKSSNLDLYNSMSSIRYISAQRKTNFFFVKNNNKLFNKMFGLFKIIFRRGD